MVRIRWEGREDDDRSDPSLAALKTEFLAAVNAAARPPTCLSFGGP